MMIPKMEWQYWSVLCALILVLDITGLVPLWAVTLSSLVVTVVFVFLFVHSVVRDITATVRPGTCDICREPVMLIWTRHPEGGWYLIDVPGECSPGERHIVLTDIQKPPKW